MREIYTLWRPTPLYPGAPAREGARARRRTSTTSTRASARPAATSRTPRVAQAYYNKAGGREAARHRDRRRPVGQRARLCLPLFGLDCKVYMVQASATTRSRTGGSLMETFGARRSCQPVSPTRSPAAQVLAETPTRRVSLGIAISEAVEDAATRRRHEVLARAASSTTCCCTRRSSGRRRIKQMEMAGDDPDIVIGCAGGGSNFAGLAFPFLGDKLARAGRTADRRRGAGRLPQPDRGRLRLRLRRHREHDPAGEDAHARARLHARRASTPAACATTAWRRW